jgi:hypothetical protein
VRPARQKVYAVQVVIVSKYAMASHGVRGACQKRIYRKILPDFYMVRLHILFGRLSSPSQDIQT